MKGREEWKRGREEIEYDLNVEDEGKECELRGVGDGKGEI